MRFESQPPSLCYKLRDIIYKKSSFYRRTLLKAFYVAESTSQFIKDSVIDCFKNIIKILLSYKLNHSL